MWDRVELATGVVRGEVIPADAEPPGAFAAIGGDVAGHPPLSAHAARMRPALRLSEAVEPRRLSHNEFWVEWAHADQPPSSSMGSIAYPFSSSPQTTSAGKSILQACGLIVSVSLNDPYRQAPRRRARPLTARLLIPAPVDELEQIILGLVRVNARDRSRVERELALRPGFQPQPECHQRRYVRHEARGGGYWF
jgi:hypothetical protein